MTTTKDLIERARLGFGTSAGMPTAMLAYQKLCDALANELERLTQPVGGRGAGSMSAQALINDLKSRINPAYPNQLGTESYERRQCVEALEKLLAENARLSALADRWNAECDEMREDNKRLAAELAAMKDAAK